MKSTSLLTLLFLFCLKVIPQNLILNPSFEFCNSSNKGTCWQRAYSCSPNDREQVCIIPHWYSYQSWMGSLNYLNGSSNWSTPDLFDSKADTNNCNIIYIYNGIKNVPYPIVGIPINFLTCFNNGYQTIDSIKPRNANNTRFAGLEAHMQPDIFTNGPYTPVNRALVGDLILNNLDSTGLVKNVCYQISFWASSPSYYNCKQWIDDLGPFNNDIIDVSLIGDGYETEIINPKLTSADQSVFSTEPVINYYSETDPTDCGDPYSDYKIPAGHWNYYQAIFYMDANTYPYNYTQIAFKLNRLNAGLNIDVPDVFIDDVSLIKIDNSNPITIQPDTIVSCGGTSPLFYVAANSSDTLIYTWQYSRTGTSNWINIDPSHYFLDTFNNYEKGYVDYLMECDNITTGYNYFRCIVSGLQCDSLTSDTAVFIDQALPTVSVTPSVTAVCSPNSGTFVAQGHSFGPFTYQWSDNSGYFYGASTDSTHTVSDAGSYKCLVKNLCGTDTTTFTLIVHPAPQITNKIDTIKVCEGNPVTFSVTDTLGTSPLSYQWYKHNTISDIPHATNSTYNINHVTLADSGKYYCTVFDGFLCADLKEIVVLKVNPLPIISHQPDNFSVCDGHVVTFSLTAIGDSLTYQWYQQVLHEGGPPYIFNSPINGEVDSSYITIYGGYYLCIIKNKYGCKATSDTVKLTVRLAPSYNANIQTDTLTCNSVFPKTYTVSPEGTKPLTYQWYHNGNSISSATNSAYTVEHGYLSENGIYTCKISNLCGNITDTIFNLIAKDSCCARSKHTISGFVKYDNKDSTIMSCKTSVYLWNANDSLVDSTVTNNTGAYTFYCLINATYHITCKSTKAWGGGNPIDALIINRSYINLTTITDPLKRLAADVNNEGRINPIDALLINRRYISLIQKYTIPDWLFSNPTVIMDGVDISKNIIALCAGDVNASYIPSSCTGLSAPPDSTIISYNNHSHSFNYHTQSTACTIGLDSMVSAPNSIINIPLRVLNFNGIAAFGFKINYDTTKLSFIKILNSTPASLDSNLRYTAKHGILGIAYSSEDSNSLNTPNAPLFYLQFNYLNGVDSLVFLSDCVLGDTSLNSVTAIYQNGFIGPLYITSQPQNDTVCLGNNATFTVVAASDTNRISYQWLKLVNGNWQLDTGQTNSQLSILNCQLSAATNYKVIVSNIYGRITSDSATLTVNIPPLIVTEPQHADTVCYGSEVSFDVIATGTALSYEWFDSNGDSISSNRILYLNAYQSNYYYCQVSNMCAAVTSDSVYLTVNTRPLITQQISNATKCTGDSLTSIIAATGTKPLSFQWYRQISGYWNLDTGKTDSALIIPNIALTDAGVYRCLVSNICGTVTSYSATLTVHSPPVITLQPIGDTLCSGSNKTFLVNATGTSPLTFHWFKNNNQLGTTNYELTMYNINTSNAGTYYSVVNNSCASISSDTAVLLVNTHPVLSLQPSSATKCNGDSLTFILAATGTKPLSYQWYRQQSGSWSLITGAIDSAFRIQNSELSDAGGYRCLISNLCGTITSNTATLTVHSHPVITVQPIGATKCTGTSVTFSLTATGTSPLSYHWYKNYELINGATFTSYQRNNINIADSGKYFCNVSNTCGTDTSDIVSLIVNVHPAITQQIIGATKCTGDTVTFTLSASGTAPLSYKWYKNSSIISNAIDSAFTIQNLASSDAGTYKCIVSNLCSTSGITSSNATLTVHTSPAITKQPSYTLGNDDMTFSLIASGTSPLSYQWLKNDTLIISATNSAYILQNLELSDTGKYFCNVTNVCGTKTSDSIIITINTLQLRHINNKSGIYDPTINIYPNPNDGTFTLDVKLPSDGNVILEAYNLIGEQVLLQQQTMQKGSNKLNLNLNGSVKGIYFFKVQTDTKTFNRKIIIE